jgi:MFS family permease
MTRHAAPRRTRRHGLPGLIPALPRAAWVVLGGDFASAVGSGLTLPFLFVYAHHVRGLPDGAAGLVVATIALASLAGNPLGGALADRWTPHRALIAGLVLAAAGSAALALARTAAELFAAAELLGLGVSVIWPAQDALLASVAGRANRSAVFAVRHACLNAGLGAGALTAAAVVSAAHPATFTAIYLADAASFLLFIPVLARLRAPAPPASQPPAGQPAAGQPPPAAPIPGPARRPRFRDVLADRTFVRVWVLTAVLVTVSFGQSQASLAGYATRPGGIGPHGLALAFAANTLTVVAAQLVILRLLAGRARTTAAALAAAAFAASWAAVAAGGHLHGAAAAGAVAAAMAIFALGECLLSPTLPAIINDLAPDGAAGRYNGLGTLAFTTGFLLGPVTGGAALGAGWGASLFTALAAACLLAAAGALRLSRHLPAAANHIPAPAPAKPPAATITLPLPGQPADHNDQTRHPQGRVAPRLPDRNSLIPPPRSALGCESSTQPTGPCPDPAVRLRNPTFIKLAHTCPTLSAAAHTCRLEASDHAMGYRHLRALAGVRWPGGH